MTAFTDPREDALVQALATERSLTAAAVAAGFGGNWRRAHARATAPRVAARAAPMRDDPPLGETGDAAAVIRTLMRLARKAENMPTAAAMGAARGLLAEAAKLQSGLDATAAIRRPDPAEWIRYRPLSDEDWLAKYAPKTSEASQAGP